MIDDKAREIHGITNEFLEDKPVFSEIINQFIEYLSDSDLIMHNAPTHAAEAETPPAPLLLSSPTRRAYYTLIYSCTMVIKFTAVKPAT